jgi:phosphopentomutase
LQRLYDICAKTRRMLDPQRVGRVIARPFVGASAETFTRTANRHDYSLAPPEPHDLTRIRDAGLSVLGIGKIHDIFAGSGITATLRTKSNAEGMTVLRQQLETFTRGLIFVNLVEFDMIYGHRRDPQGYAHCLQEFDTQLTGLLPCLRGDDLLMLCADHGLDPTFPGTDHTRETVPILLYSPALPARALGVRSSFADIGATACAALGVAMSTPSAGQSLLT